MIVDTSAIIAMLADEQQRPALLAKLDSAQAVRMSTATYVETAAVIDRRGDPVLSRRLDEFLDAYDTELLPVTPRQAQLARSAYRDFGKGSGHRAGLNFGDCFSYALAVERDEPLLFVGDDFGHTDVRPVRHA